MKKTILLALLVLMGVGFVNAQNRVTGTVTSADDGSPLPFVTVTVKGTTVVASTGNDGTYAINVPSESSVLVFSFVSMETQEIQVGSRSIIDVVMSSDSEVLQAAVVTAMGIQRSDKSMGYAVAKVDTDAVKMKAEPDALRALDGKIPGVQINSSSSTAGSATRITIRGTSSFFGDNQPLFVVDGIPYSNTQSTTNNQLTGTGGAYGSSFSTLDPNDIESMNVLKGAAAAALYGSRAANGVIVITTKSGSKRARPSQKGLEVTVSGSYSWEKVALPEYQNKFGAGSSFNANNGSNGSWGAPFSEVSEIPTWSGYRENYPDLFGETVPYKAYPDNIKDLFDTGGMYDLSTTVSSNNDKGGFSTTVSRMKQDGFIPHSVFERYAFSAGGNQRLDNGLRIGGNVSYSRTIQDGAPLGAANYNGSASTMARTMLLARNWDMSTPYKKVDGGSLFFVAADNPKWGWEYNTIHTVAERSVANFSVGLNITSWLTADYQIGVNSYNQTRKSVIDRGSIGAGGDGTISWHDVNTEEIESNFLLTANKRLNDDFTLRAVAGHNFNIRKYGMTYFAGTVIMSPGLYTADNLQNITGNQSSSTDRRLWALFADVSVSFRDYLFLNITGRNDWSSTLPKDNRSYFYPAVASSFVFTDAFKVLKNDILTMGKIRVGWGMVGNDAAPYYTNGYYASQGTWNGNSMLSLDSYLYDPDLSPEFTKEWEIGAELQFLNNRVNLDFTWYNRNTTDQIAYIAMPASTGISRYYTNYGELRNRGIEIGLTATPIKLANSFQWDLSGTVTLNRSKVLALTEGVERIPVMSTNTTSEVENVLEVGQPYGIIRGSYILRDTDGTPLVNPATGAYYNAPDTKNLGDPNPDWLMSISNTFSYKGIFASATFNFTFGGDMIAGTIGDMMGRGVTKDSEDRYGTRILTGVYGNADGTPILDGNGNRVRNTTQLSEFDLWFSPDGSNTFGVNTVHEYELFDATVFRLSEITVGYELPKKWVEKVKLGGASISFVGRNLWYHAPNFPKYSNYDPGIVNTFGATNIQGVERGGAPSMRRYSINLKLTF